MTRLQVRVQNAALETPGATQSKQGQDIPLYVPMRKTCYALAGSYLDAVFPEKEA